jgi:hypothetical protein
MEMEGFIYWVRIDDVGGGGSVKLTPTPTFLSSPFSWTILFMTM